MYMQKSLKVMMKGLGPSLRWDDEYEGRPAQD